MKDNVQDPKVNLAYQVEEIEELIEKNGYVEALALIREVQISGKLDSCTLEPGEFYYLSAKVFRHLGSYQEAKEAGQRAISIFIEFHDELKIAQTQYLLGLIYIAVGDLKLAEIEVRDAFTGFKRCNDYKGIIDCLSRLSQIEFIRGNYTKSIEYLQDALGYSYKAEDPKKKAILYGNLGQRFSMIGNWEEAERNLLLNTGLNRQAKDELNLCRGLLSLGYVYFLKREFKKTKETYEESLSLVQKNNCVRELAIFHEYSGELAFVQGGYQSAENHYNKVLEIMGERAPEGDMISQTYRLIADLQVARKEYDLALNSCGKALRVSISLGEKLEESACYRILGQIHTGKGNKEKARENFEKSLSILEEIQAKYELAKTYLEIGSSNSFEYFERLKYLGMAEDVFKSLESKHNLALINKALAQLFFENQEYEQAGLFLKDAEKVFKELKEKKDLEVVQEFRRKLEKYSGEIELSEPEKKYTFSHIITQNKEMLEILEKAKQIKDTDMTVLIEGETGTGKDLFAKCIHYESKRKGKRFVSVSCAAIPEALLESELFGHKKGAFTSAGYDKKGLLEEADCGTLFLNEVADLPLSIQAKLLGVIENKELTRLGETTPRKVNFRVIAASNKDLEEELRKGNFRDDLYYRLKVIKFVLPPLRERKEDVPLLLEHFIKSYFDEKDVELDEEVIERLTHYGWPGNVRELKHEIEKLAVSVANDEKLVSQLLSEMIVKLRNGECSKNASSLYGEVAEFEKKKIMKVLEDNDWIKTKAAKALKIPVTTLKNKIRRYGISRPF